MSNDGDNGAAAVAVRKQTRMILVILPIIMAVLIVGGVFLGFHVSDIMGSHGSLILPIVFATVGLFAALAVSLVVIKIILKDSPAV
ncbi:MAG: hypothetical protein M1503_12695 [Thaumarchaeota archaeon]|nr:hypothetical protein [Nitrososphaerota archaeon]MCL5319098.1 hypothetical protein [Nitrososphaerota archaeon]